MYMEKQNLQYRNADITCLIHNNSFSTREHAKMYLKKDSQNTRIMVV